MSQTDFIVQNDSTHPLVNKYDHRFMCAQAFEGEASYIIRKNGSYYEAIKKYSASSGGMIIYGGVSNSGGVTGTDFDAVLEAAATAIGYNGKIFIKTGIYATNGLNFKNTAAVTDATQQMLEIAGEGMGNTIIRGNTTSTGAASTDAGFTNKAWVMIDSFDTSGIRVHLHDFQIDGQHDSQTNIISGIVLKYGRDAILERLFIQRCSQDGINVVGPNLAYRAITIQDCFIHDINDPDHTPSLPRLTYCSGINCSVGCADVFIYHNFVGYIGLDVAGGAPRPWSGNGISLGDSCQAHNNTIWGVACGIETYPGSSNHIIQSNFIDFSDVASIFLNTSYNTNCSNNTIRIPYVWGIYLADANNNSVQNNKFQLPTTVVYTATNNGAADGTTVINTTQAESNDYWNGFAMKMITGTCAAEEVVITDYNSTTHTFTLTGAGFSAQIDAGDTYQLKWTATALVNETGTSDYNSVIGNNLYVDGVVTWTLINLSGSNTLCRDNAGWKTEGTVLSPAFAVDAINGVTVTIPHGLNITPRLQDCSVTVVVDTNVSDYGFHFIRIAAADSVNVYVELYVDTASVTGGATAKLALTCSNPYSG